MLYYFYFNTHFNKTHKGVEKFQLYMCNYNCIRVIVIVIVYVLHSKTYLNDNFLDHPTSAKNYFRSFIEVPKF